MTTTRRPRLPYRAPQSERHHYVFLARCGCPRGLVEATPRTAGGPPRITDEDAAWDSMYDTRAEERAARARGVHVVHVDHAQYERDFYALMLKGCPHGGAS